MIIHGTLTSLKLPDWLTDWLTDWPHTARPLALSLISSPEYLQNCPTHNRSQEGSQVWIPRVAWMSVVSVVLSEVSATGWSFVQRSPTDHGVPERDREASLRPWPTGDSRVMHKVWSFSVCSFLQCASLLSSESQTSPSALYSLTALHVSHQVSHPYEAPSSSITAVIVLKQQARRKQCRPEWQ